MPSVNDWPLVPVPPPRGVKTMALRCGSLPESQESLSRKNLRGTRLLQAGVDISNCRLQAPSVDHSCWSCLFGSPLQQAVLKTRRVSHFNFGRNQPCNHDKTPTGMLFFSLTNISTAGTVRCPWAGLDNQASKPASFTHAISKEKSSSAEAIPPKSTS